MGCMTSLGVRFFVGRSVHMSQTPTLTIWGGSLLVVLGLVLLPFCLFDNLIICFVKLN